MADEAIIIGEGWLSEHFFTTDAKSQSFQAQVLARRKEWDEQDTDGTRSTRARFNAIRAQLESRLAILEPGSNDLGIREDLYDAVLETLGYQGGGCRMEREGPLLRVTQPGLSEGSPLVIIEGRPADTIEDLLVKDAQTLLVPFETDTNEKHAIDSVARLLSAVFVEEDGPIFALVLAGKWMLVAERDRWAEGRYLAVDLQLVVARNDPKRGGEIDRALTCVAAGSLAPDADGDIWWTRALDESIKHTVGVSQDLREGVRLSIEIIANDVVARRSREGLEPLPQAEAQTLAKQSLRFLYRILFLLFAEASPELKVLPVGTSEYEEGYSLDRLRELTLVTLATEQAEHGTHFYESLEVLFRLVDQGHGVRAVEPAETSLIEPVETSAPDLRDGLTFNSLRADLFLPKATALIDEVKLSDAELQKVLAHLLLSKEQKGRDRGFISYADLGINQLGAVYEGLMSYTGFFADTELYEVAKDGNAQKGSWVVPVERSEGIDAKDFVKTTNPITGEVQAVVHDRGSFVFRLAGRERQQSASYYTPEVLTRFTVSQALEELLDQNGSTTTAAEILELTVCEPALGSGAFALEAVRQLAAEYLNRRQKELGEDIDPDAYPRELQKVKASIALHQVYGVDLNATAVELAEISLWLDTMSEDLQAPWFGLHLKRGNSLIGARRAIYSRDQVNSKSWLKAVPRDIPVTDLANDIREGRVASGLSGSIHHFLLPAEGWGSATEAKEAKELAPEAFAALKVWLRKITSKPTKKQLDQLAALSIRVETLWQFAFRRLEIAEREVRRQIPLWGAVGPMFCEGSGPAVTREEIEAKLNDPNGAYQRLRRVMDAWNALWFWPLTDTLTEGAQPPTLDEWVAGATSVLGVHFEVQSKLAAQGQTTISLPTRWEELGIAESADLAFASVASIDEARREHPWLKVAERISEQQGFLHWELDFATVFSRGGFDLQTGNPPWVRPDFDEAAALAEYDSWWALTNKPPVKVAATKRTEVLAETAARIGYIDSLVDVVATREAVSSVTRFPILAGLRPDLYRCFMEQTWRNGSPRGVISLLHPETHFTDEKAGPLRSATYPRLRRHWQFINELSLFDIHHLVSYGVHVYGETRVVGFDMATSLYHPDTVRRSYEQNGTGPEPGVKGPDGHWDLRPHRGRIITVSDETLQTWHAVLEDSSVPVLQTRMVYAVNKATAVVIEKLSYSRRIGELDLQISQGWNETTDFKAGYFEKTWGVAPSWREAILQGPNIYVSAPFYKAPNKSMLHNQDWSAVDLEVLAPDCLPTTSYKPAHDADNYDAAYTHWGDNKIAARDHYRIAWRNMAANTGSRTLIPAIIPPGSSHVHGITAVGLPGQPIELVAVASSLSSLLSDFVVRVAPKSTISASTVSRLPLPVGPLRTCISLRGIRLNALTDAYAELWENTFTEDYMLDEWAGGPDYLGRPRLGDVTRAWTPAAPLRRASDRRQALVEIDALVALALDLTADELCTTYRTQFAVLFGFDRNAHFYDSNGRLVPKSVLAAWRANAENISEAERTSTSSSGNTYKYELPFATLDREADMRQAYSHFEKILAERS